MFIRDVKSSNGTFINGERLSPEGQESEVYELHSEDVVEFGIDIVSDDSKTIVHHKVAGRVYLVMTAEDALGIRNDFANIYRGNNNNQGGALGGPGMGPGAEGGLRRGKSTMSFDHIIGRLQMELQRSREQGQEISSLSSTVNEIQESLDGGMAPLPEAPYQHLVPALQQDRGKPAADGTGEHGQAHTEASEKAVALLQAQLTETQSSIASQVERIRTLESMLAEQEVIRAEVGTIKSQMEEAKRELDQMANAKRMLPQASNGGVAPTLGQLKARDEVNGHSERSSDSSDDDFDDGASMISAATVTPGADMGNGPKGADEVESEELENDGHEGPRAPPDLPPELAARDAAGAAAVAEQGASNAAKSAASLSSSTEEQLQAQNRALTTRLEALEVQLEEALSFGRTLQSQHVLATENVKALESRIDALDAQMKSASTSHEELITKALEGRFSQWKEQIEADWKAERRDWERERDDLRQVIQAWDLANGRLEEQAAHQVALGEAASTDAHHRGISGSEAPKSPVSGAMSSGASSSSSSSRRRASRSAKRRQTKRHLNPTLRALLYKDSHNIPLEDDGAQSSEEEGEGGAGRSLTSGSASTDGRRSSSTATTATDGATPTPSSSLSHGQSDGSGRWKTSSSDRHGDGTLQRNKALGYAFEHPAHSIPALSAVAVLIGVAAWAVLGKEGAAGGR